MTAWRPLPNRREHTTQKVRIARLMRVWLNIGVGPFRPRFRICAPLSYPAYGVRIGPTMA
jgi:hypothetical protein